jgi:hypothetical protein
MWKLRHCSKYIFFYSFFTYIVFRLTPLLHSVSDMAACIFYLSRGVCQLSASLLSHFTHHRLRIWYRWVIEQISIVWERESPPLPGMTLELFYRPGHIPVTILTELPPMLMWEGILVYSFAINILSEFFFEWGLLGCGTLLSRRRLL